MTSRKSPLEHERTSARSMVLKGIEFEPVERSTAEQAMLPFKVEWSEVYAQQGAVLLSLVREVVRANVKQADDFAAELKIAPSYLSMALNRNPRCNFSLTWLPAVLHIDGQRRVLKHLGGLVGCKVEEKRPLTDRQKLTAVLRKLKQRGVDTEHLEREAYAEEEP